MVAGSWATPFLKKLFEEYLAANGNDPSKLVTVLNRH
jgi:hypothetical protein